MPPEVAINEAVVLAKRYASEDAARLVNGILGGGREKGRARGAERERTAEEALGAGRGAARAAEGDAGRAGAARGGRGRRGGRRGARRSSPSSPRRSRPSSRRRAPRGRCCRSPDELRALVEGYLGELEFTPELGGLEEAAALSARVGWQARAPGALRSPSPRRRARARSTACRRRRRSSSCTRSRSSTTTCRRSTTTTSVAAGRRAHIAFGEATRCSPATRCSRRRSGSRSPTRRRRSAASSRGDARDDRRPVPRRDRRDGRSRGLHRLKTGALFSAAVGVALWAAGVPAGSSRRGARSAPSSACSSRSWTTCSTATASVAHGAEGARALGDEAAERAQERLGDPGRHVGARRDRRRPRRPTA